MRLNPRDIREQQFTVRKFRGLDTQEVEAFLEDVADDYESIMKENALLKEQLDALEERARTFAEREKTLQETLVTTHRITEEMKHAARRDAELVRREAEITGEKILEGARAEEARLRAEVNELRRLRRQLAEDVKVMLGRYEPMIVEDLRSTFARYGRLVGEEPANGNGQGK